MLSASDVQRVAADLIVAGNRVRRRPVSAVLEPLAAAVEQWCTAGCSLRQRAERELPAATGFSPAMIRHGLPLLLEPLRGDAVGRVLDMELGGRATMDRTCGPPLILHVLSGNIPALAAAPLILSLAIKSAAMLKASHGDRIFPSLFIESLRMVDTELAQCAAALYWPGGRLDVEAAAFEAADLVIASGDDATITDIARRVPGRFIGHGHRISFAAIAREELRDADALARRLAYDVVLWDQQGCLSPQLAYVERGGPMRVERFAELLAAQLRQFAEELPLRGLSLDEQAVIQRFRHAAEWRAVRGEEVTIFASPAAVDWTVVYDAAPVFAPTPLNRTIWLKPIESLGDLPALLAPARTYLEAAGVAAPATRSEEVHALLKHAGVHRVCPLGEMQRPDLTWRQGGRPRIADWVRPR